MHPALRAILPACLAVGILAGALPAGACPSCLSGAEGTREAYYGTTILLMLVPFVGLGLVIWWIRRAAASATRSPP